MDGGFLMIKRTVEEVAKMAGAEDAAEFAKAIEIQGVTIDSRKIEKRKFICAL